MWNPLTKCVIYWDTCVLNLVVVVEHVTIHTFLIIPSVKIIKCNRGCISVVQMPPHMVWDRDWEISMQKQTIWHYLCRTPGGFLAGKIWHDGVMLFRNRLDNHPYTSQLGQLTAHIHWMKALYTLCSLSTQIASTLHTIISHIQNCCHRFAAGLVRDCTQFVLPIYVPTCILPAWIYDLSCKQSW